jgi:hypothetical protein
LSGYILVVTGYASPHVDEIILGLGFLKTHSVVWDFATGSITMFGKSFKDMKGVCRRVILEEGVEIPPRSEMVLSAYVRYKGAIHTNGMVSGPQYRNSWLLICMSHGLCYQHARVTYR